MRSRAARLISSALACLALGGALVFLRQTERQFDQRREHARQFEQRARDASSSIGDAGAALQAYVAAGQSSSVWIPKVKALSNQAAANIDALRSMATATNSRQALLEASASITEFTTIDKQAREYLAGGQALMASDVVFSEGGDAVADIEHQVGVARQAEEEAEGAATQALRQQQALAGGGAALFVALVLIALGLSRREPSAAPAVSPEDVQGSESLPMAPVVAAPQAVMADEAVDRDAAALRAAASVSTAFGQVHDVAGLKRALGQAATVLDASGLVVWLGSTQGTDLRPVAAHGYSDHVLGLMRPVARHADNAAAAAYRTSKLQIVAAKPGTSLGAVVAPILSAEGCIGALTAEIRADGEVSETVHAVATIIASQLAGVLASAAAQAAAAPSHVASA